MQLRALLRQADFDRPGARPSTRRVHKYGAPEGTAPHVKALGSRIPRGFAERRRCLGRLRLQSAPSRLRVNARHQRGDVFRRSRGQDSMPEVEDVPGLRAGGLDERRARAPRSSPPARTTPAGPGCPAAPRATRRGGAPLRYRSSSRFPPRRNRTPRSLPATARRPWCRRSRAPSRRARAAARSRASMYASEKRGYASALSNPPHVSKIITTSAPCSTCCARYSPTASALMASTRCSRSGRE